MSVYINFVCDKEGCRVVQPVFFDKLEETWKDMLDAMQSFGWTLELDEHKVSKCYCPNHK